MLVSSAVPELGRFFTEFDVQTRRRVCVIGTTIHDQLFDGRDPLNKKLKIGRDAFRVIGVMEEQGSAGFFGGPDFDSQVLIPITTFSKVFGGRFRDFNLAVKAPPGADIASGSPCRQEPRMPSAASATTTAPISTCGSTTRAAKS